MEDEVLKFWKVENIFRKSLAIKKDAPIFIFYEGPPTANDKPGTHHVFARTLKDIVCRYKAMQGYLVDRKAGWDTHGLPVELAVEKELGLNHKKEIEEYGIAKFNARCKESVFKYKEDWENITESIGYWLDMDNPYITCETYYIESVWWLLAQFFNAGLMYRDYKILPYCPRCGTGLSDHEVAQGYRDVEDPSIFVRMKIKGENAYFLVWTTTPWTLLSNVALAVNPNEKYVRVRHKGDEYIMLRYRVEAVLGEDFEIIDQFMGDTLEGMEYEPLYNFVETKEKKHYVILSDFVTVEDGTGIVHIAPAFGKEDFEEGKKHDLPVVQLIDEEGNVKEEAIPFAGMAFKKADPEILKDLEDRGLLFRLETIVHSYPHCWRCDSPLINYARASWYIQTTNYKDKLIENNQHIKWYPPQIRDGRFGDWLENNIDWALSRERFWGTPLNIWVCENCDHKVAIDSMKMLQEMSTDTIPEDIDLHRPFVDEISLKCPECEGKMRRVSEIIDCWFDSGAMPYAQYHYPHEEEENFDKRFPADFICEGLDQTRGWFYTLLAISTFISGESSYKTCIVNGLILDKDGQKMSKSKGNVVDPVEIINQYGADPLRWYLITVNQPWLPIQFDLDGLEEVSRKFFGTLKNLYSFFSMYANIDNFKPTKDLSERELSHIDKWILSRLNSLIKEVTENMDDYQITKSARVISDFVIDDLSNWYVRRSRQRFWLSGLDDDKYNAFHVLWKCLVEVIKLIAPYIPMTAEWYWKALLENFENKFPESVHFTGYPETDNDMIDEDLEEEMTLAIGITTLIRAARNKARLKVRQPLEKAVIVTDSKQFGDEVMDIIKDEINIKILHFTNDVNLLKEFRAEPNFKEIGPRFGAEANTVAESIKSLDKNQIDQIKEKGEIGLTLDNGNGIKLKLSDIKLVAAYSNDYEVIEEENLIVGIDTRLSEELVMEGFAREVVNKVQNSRKNADFEVTNRIVLNVVTTSKVEQAIKEFKEYITGETLSIEVIFGKPEKYDWNEDWDINGEPTGLYLKIVESDGNQ
ncbi:isoleucine--tRNA ligase [bacterium]|nr:isoleucine--tRNA ligase [bacterium]